MKRLVLITLCLSCGASLADEYRYKQMVTTGLQERIFDKNGKGTTIVFSKESNAEAIFLLRSIIGLGGIGGTKGKEDWRGVPFEQAIILNGRLKSENRRTSSGPELAEAEDYREFVLEDVMVRFPLIRHCPGKIIDTAYLETHFSYDTLFPDGLKFKGEPIDLAKHAKSEQGIAPSDR